MKKALITGITGQDGSYLAEFLISKGYEVHGIIRRALADGGNYGTGFGREMSFITSNISPIVATGYATAITTNAARLNGSLSSMGSSARANVSFQWGAAHGTYTNETAAQSMTSAGSFWADLSGLTQGGTYYFRAKAAGGYQG